MTGILLRGAALAAMYLLVLTSVAVGDVVIGCVLGVAVAYALRPRSPVPETLSVARLRAAAGLLARTAAEVVRGSWRTARFCLGDTADPGMVEIPRAGRSPVDVALWGVLSGEAPDEVVVDVDEERDVLVVHLLDAGDPAAVRARHAQSYERWRATEGS